MGTEDLAVVVAGIAVFAGALFQYLTIRGTRENTVSQVRASLLDSRHTALRQTLAEYMALTYHTDRLQRAHPKKDFPREYYEYASQEDRLRNVILLHLDPTNPSHAELMETLEYLRDGESDDIWIHRRNKFLALAQQVFAQEEGTIVV